MYLLGGRALLGSGGARTYVHSAFAPRDGEEKSACHIRQSYVVFSRGAFPPMSDGGGTAQQLTAADGGSFIKTSLSHPRFFTSILSSDTAKDRPITDTDVQNDGRRLRVHGDPCSALPASSTPCCGCRRTSVMITDYVING
eukprot:scaffold1352_cov129-Isochrysis_galbana.AAC.4